MKSLRKRLTRWRTLHGGKGQRIPEKLWAEAVEIASIEGVESTARLLHLDSARLRDRVSESKGGHGATDDQKPESESKSGHDETGDQKPELEFVEVELPQERSWAMIKMVSCKGNELHIAGMASTVDIHGLVRDFWRHC
jgi:hypothetical protein